MAAKQRFSKYESVILLEGLLDYLDGKLTKKDAVRRISHDLRTMAVNQGHEIDDSFRNEVGIGAQIENMHSAFVGHTIQRPAPSHFVEIVTIYQYHHKIYSKLLKEAKQMINLEKSVKEQFVAYLNDVIPVENVPSGKKAQARKKKQTIIKNLLHCVSEVQSFGKKEGILTRDLFETTDTNVISPLARTIQSSSYLMTQRKEIYFRMVGLMNRYHAFLRDVYRPVRVQEPSLPPKKNGSPPTEAILPSDHICYDFTNAKRFQGTVPVNCSVGGQEITEKTWGQTLVRLTELMLEIQNPAMNSLYQNTDWVLRKTPFLMKERFPDMSCAQLSNGYWICTNYSLPDMVKHIGILATHCGYNRDEIKLYGIPKKQTDGASKQTTGKASKNDDNIPEMLLQVINNEYPNGIRFDSTVISLLHSKPGVSISKKLIGKLEKKMFKRSDGMLFLPEMIASENTLEGIKADLHRILDAFSICEVSCLFQNNRNTLNRNWLRDENDFADFLEYLLPNEVRAASVYRCKILRPVGVKTDEAVTALSERLLSVTADSGCVTEDDLFELCPYMTGDFLQKLMTDKSDEIIVTYINDILCYQTIEALGLDESFSDAIHAVLDRIEELSLAPTQEIIHALLSVEMGMNIKASYAISDDKTFRRVVAMYYTGERSRRWRGNSFLEE